MNELLFPIAAAAMIALLVLPAFAGFGSLVLGALDRAAGARLVRFSALRYLLLVLPTLLPLGWAISAGLHQAETGRSVLACLVSHDLEELCVEPRLFVALLVFMVAVRLAPFLRGASLCWGAGGSRDSQEARRVAALLERYPGLAALRGRTVVCDNRVGGSAAVGLLRPIVALDADFVRSCDDDALHGALAHELEHVRSLDPLRYLLLALAIRVNPMGEKLLGRHAAAWLFSREVQCDRAAVLKGADPFAVARALLTASRPRHAAIAHLGGAAAKLRVRVELVLAYAERPPANDVRQGAFALAFLALFALFAIALPHGGGTHPLDALHTAVERGASQVFH